MNEETASGLILTGVLFMILVFVVLIVLLMRSSSSDVPEGVTGADLRIAVDLCIPYNATFEQELACYQAVYGGSK